MFQTVFTVALLTLSTMDAILSMFTNTKVHKPHTLKKIRLHPESGSFLIWILEQLGYNCSPGPHPQISERKYFPLPSAPLLSFCSSLLPSDS